MSRRWGPTFYYASVFESGSSGVGCVRLYHVFQPALGVITSLFPIVYVHPKPLYLFFHPKRQKCQSLVDQFKEIKGLPF